MIPCEKNDCKLTEFGSSTTLVGWNPQYDSKGKLINKNPNSTYTNYSCFSCHKSFLKITNSEEIIWKII